MLTDINGKSTVSVNGLFPARGRVPVQFRWRVPAGIPSFPRIYVVIDPNNKIDESYEDNNIGFNFIKSAGVASSVFKITKKNDPFVIKLQPNPANNSGTELQLSLPTEGYLNVEISDISGRTIKKLYNSDQKAWSGNFTIPIKTSDLIKGMYFVNVSFNGKSHLLKMVKLE